jgi:hypothetical protein
MRRKLYGVTMPGREDSEWLVANIERIESASYGPHRELLRQIAMGGGGPETTPAYAVPPKGPMPKQGGAEAPLTFD